MILALLMAAPLFVSDDAGLAAAAQQVWTQLAEQCAHIAGESCRERLERVRLDYDDALPTGHGGASRVGELRVRHGAAQLRHELAHQFVFSFCPRASPLFHEAFAMTAAGELDAWKPYATVPYETVAEAQRILQSAPLDTPPARRSLARILDDAGGWPDALRAQVRACVQDGALPELTARSLVSAAEVADAFVVISRHSGEVLQREGAADLPMPPGSTLKPFLFASRANAPVLPRSRTRIEWRCGEDAPDAMSGAEALWRSCNGYFFDWGVHDFGVFTQALGGAHPANVAEAIGLAPVVRVSPIALAEAYRALALASPETMGVLHETARRGTLAGTSDMLATEAVKTGTVRRPDGSVVVGWIVVVSDDWIAVRARASEMPRAFAHAFGEQLTRVRLPAASAAEVQVFGLLPLAQVKLACAVPFGGAPATAAEIDAPVLCLSGPWRVTIAGVTRFYAGSFTRSPAPPPSSEGSEREARARRGSDILFRTSLALYTGGVLASEDSGITGEPRRALASVIAHNQAHSRHAARPICDTTHCQLFQGTAPLATTLVPLSGGFLQFARGGNEPWQRAVSATDIRARFGDVVGWHFTRGTAQLTMASDGSEELREVGCELVRAPLRLPSCPDRAAANGDSIVFSGRGEGHGLGLDVERAKRSHATAEALLQQAYAR